MLIAEIVFITDGQDILVDVICRMQKKIMCM